MKKPFKFTALILSLLTMTMPISQVSAGRYKNKSTSGKSARSFKHSGFKKAKKKHDKKAELPAVPEKLSPVATSPAKVFPLTLPQSHPESKLSIPPKPPCITEEALQFSIEFAQCTQYDPIIFTMPKGAYVSRRTISSSFSELPETIQRLIILFKKAEKSTHKLNVRGYAFFIKNWMERACYQAAFDKSEDGQRIIMFDAIMDVINLIEFTCVKDGSTSQLEEGTCFSQLKIEYKNNLLTVELLDNDKVVYHMEI